MEFQQLAVLAGTISTTLFAASQVPMLVQARRTKDLRSYSALNLMPANVGNAFHWRYVISLPFGPILVSARLLHARHHAHAAVVRRGAASASARIDSDGLSSCELL